MGIKIVNSVCCHGFLARIVSPYGCESIFRLKIFQEALCLIMIHAVAEETKSLFYGQVRIPSLWNLIPDSGFARGNRGDFLLRAGISFGFG